MEVNMAVFYLNAASSTQDGSTPSTGYHNLQNMLTNVTTKAGDVLNLIGTIDDHTAATGLLLDGVTIQSYYGPSAKPLWYVSNKKWMPPFINQTVNMTLTATDSTALTANQNIAFAVNQNLKVPSLSTMTGRNNEWSLAPNGLPTGLIMDIPE
jgi:hypothetical protein